MVSSGVRPSYAFIELLRGGEVLDGDGGHGVSVGEHGDFLSE
jgi:hypothetical protein